MYETKEYFYGTGRRKHSVARVRVYNGTGKFTINGRDIDDYIGLDTLKLLARSPLVLTGTEGQFDVVVNVVGGGCSGQAGAIRHGLARALLQFNPELRPTPQEGRLPDPRSSYEGNVRSTASRPPVALPSSASADQRPKSIKKARKTAVFRAFSISKVLSRLTNFE